MAEMKFKPKSDAPTNEKLYKTNKVIDKNAKLAHKE